MKNLEIYNGFKHHIATNIYKEVDANEAYNHAKEEIVKATGYSKSTVIKFLKTAENFAYDVTDKLAQQDVKQAISEVIAYWHGLGIDAQFAKENGLEGLSYLQGSIKLNV